MIESFSLYVSHIANNHDAHMFIGNSRAHLIDQFELRLGRPVFTDDFNTELLGLFGEW